MRTRRGGAFTLIELLVVILIIAVMSAVIVPAFAGYYEKSRFDAQIRRVQDYFALAREKAVKGDTTVTLHYEHSIHEMSISIDAPPPQNDMPTAMLTASGTDLNPGQTVSPLRIGDDYLVENFNATGASGPSGRTQTDVTFRGDGTSDSAAFDVKSKVGYTAHMTLTPMNGRLSLDEPMDSGR